MTGRWTRHLATLASCALLVAACGSDDPAATPIDDEEPPAPEQTVDGSWTMVVLTVDGTPVEPDPDRSVTLTVDGDRVSGRAACNSYGGTLGTEPTGASGEFRVGELSWTEMGCEPDVMELEQRYLAALQAVEAYELAGELSLSSADEATTIRFARQTPIPDAELTGTTWVLDTYLDGDAASNMPGMEDAFVIFDADGTMTGSTSCRFLEGEWVLEGTTLQLPALSAAGEELGEACTPESVAVDELMITVVESGTTVAIDGNRLTLTAPGGEGLSFSASPAG